MTLVGSSSDESSSADRERGIARQVDDGHIDVEFARSGRGSARDSLHGVFFLLA